MTDQPKLGEVTSALFGDNPLSTYDTLLVPRLFGPFGENMCDAVGITAGDRVLDVACGTGAVTRTASKLAGPSGSVTGVDLTPPMLAVAQGKGPVDDGAPIDYRQGDAAALPVEDASHNVVTCQQGLQFFPDRPAAASEMFRALESGGRVAVACWAGVDNVPPFAAMQGALREITGDGPASGFFAAPFAFSDADALASTLTDAGFTDVTVTQVKLPFVFEDGPSQLIGMLATAPPQLGLSEVTDEDRARIVSKMGELLGSDLIDGAIRSHAITNLAIGRKA